MVAIFKTNITDFSKADEIIFMLSNHLPGCKINFDLQDCDNILRVKGDNVSVTEIIQLVISTGAACALLD
jgi:hypothetical protein